MKNKKKRGRPRLPTTKRERSETKNAHVSKSRSKWTLMAVEAINKSEARDAIQCCRDISHLAFPDRVGRPTQVSRLKSL